MSDLSKRRILAIAAGSTGLAAVAVLGGGIASAAGGGIGSGHASSAAAARSSSAQRNAATSSSATPAPRPSGSPGTGQGPGSQGSGQGRNGGGPGGGPGGGSGGPGGGPRGGGPGGGGPGGMVVHGRDVVKSGSTYSTVDVQQGKVTAVSATSLTVVSSDDYSETYVLTSSTTYGHDGKASDIAVGDSVHVRATVTGDTATATSVDEGKPPAAQPTPSASATSSS